MDTMQAVLAHDPRDSLAADRMPASRRASWIRGAP
jgi:hypothetical protein